MTQTFDIFNEYEIPEVELCYPNRKKICDLSRITSLSVTLRLNSLSEISLTVLAEADGIKTPFYDSIVAHNKLHVNGIGWFIIGDADEEGDGKTKYKTVPASSEEVFFNSKSVSLLEGTYKFYDPLNNSNTICGKIMGFIPSWSLGTVSTSLWNKYRTFDVTTSTLYAFMINTVSEAYECFFRFDTENRVIDILDSTDILSSTNIVLSFDNLVKNIKITQKSDEYVTALSVTGGGGLDIRSVNPVGGTFIYDFSYPVEQGWMSSELSAAVVAWQSKIDAQQSTYASKLSDYKDLSAEYITLQSEMTDLNAQKTSVETLMQVRIDAGVTDLSDLNAQLAVILGNIASKQSEIDANRSSANALYAEISAIVSDLSITNNFTTALYIELQDYVIESSYQNSNIIKTSIMTNDQIQEQSQTLYDQGKNVLAQLSRPRCEFSLTSANFVFLKEYIKFTNQLKIGSTMRIEIEEDSYFTPALLEYQFDYYDPSSFSMTFGNRLKLDDSGYQYKDLVGNAISAGNSVNVNSTLWNDWSANYQSDVSSFISNTLDASRNAIINSDNQQITIDAVGLRGKKLLENGTYDPKQLWLTSSTMAYTKDNWDTVSLAIGNITLPDGTNTYGVVGGALVGSVIAGEELTIENENNKFYVDKDGVTIVDGDFVTTKSDNSAKITINPSTGFKLETSDDSGTTWTDAIYLDTEGNATFAGKLVATLGTIGGFNISSSSIYSTVSDSNGSIISLNSDGTCRIGGFKITKAGTVYSAEFSGKLTTTSGTIGGWTITSDRLSNTGGDYIDSDGSGKLGLLSYNGSSATFTGNVYANNISVGATEGYISGNQIGSGTVSGGNIGSHTITGINMEAAYATLKADVATLNQVIAGSVAASYIRTSILGLGRPVGSTSSFSIVQWRTINIDGTDHVLLGV